MWYKIKFTLGILVAIIFVIHMHNIYQKPQVTTAGHDKKMSQVLADNQTNTNIKWY